LSGRKAAQEAWPFALGYESQSVKKRISVFRLVGCVSISIAITASARLFAGAIGKRVQAKMPQVVTFERTVSKRRKGTILIDAIQNAKEKPLEAPHLIRPFAGAPVSTPGRQLKSGEKSGPKV
jgi:hypothetical protein